MCCCVAVKADCIAKLDTRKPIYEVVVCGPAEPIVETLRQSRPDWFRTISYTEADVVITVRAVNADARKRMRKEMEYWYYPSGCANIRVGMRFLRPELQELCCDVGPVSSLPCGVGGTQLLTLNSSGAQS
jgi:hypothetical protein